MEGGGESVSVMCQNSLLWLAYALQGIRTKNVITTAVIKTFKCGSIRKAWPLRWINPVMVGIIPLKKLSLVCPLSLPLLLPPSLFLSPPSFHISSLLLLSLLPFAPLLPWFLLSLFCYFLSPPIFLLAHLPWNITTRRLSLLHTRPLIVDSATSRVINK